MTPQPTILFLLNNFPNIGGVEQVTTLLSNALSSRYTVQILSIDASLDHQPGLDPAIAIAVIPQELDWQQKIDYYNQYLEQHGIDIVINQGGYTHMTPLVLNPKRPKRVRVITALHGVPMHERIWYKQQKRRYLMERKKGWVLYRSLLKLRLGLYKEDKAVQKQARANHQQIAQLGDVLVLYTKGYVATYRREYKVSHTQRVEIIPNPIRIEEIPVAREVKSKTILFVGRLSNIDKRIDRLLSMWSQIQNDYPDWDLKLLGDGPDREMLEQLSRKLSLQRVSFCGFGDPVVAYQKASIVAITSQMEGWCMSLIECQQYGCVPIAFGCSAGLLDVLDNGRSGVMVTPYSQSEYIRKLKHLMDDQPYRQRRADACWQYARRFDIDSVVRQWEALINSLCC